MHGRRARCLGISSALVLATGACATGTPHDSAPRLAGQRIEVLATWSGTEQQHFERVLASFERRTGATVVYTSAAHRLPAVLSQRIARGDAPDVAFLPQPGVLADLARAGRLQPLDRVTEAVVAAHFSPELVRLASYAQRLYGVWFKAANKSLVWYDIGSFERLGVVPPRDLSGLMSLAGRFAAAGEPAFAVSAADGWTLTDWFENVYLREAGPRAYDDLARHRVRWTDPSVVTALRDMAALLAPGNVAGGVRGAQRLTFEGSVEQVFDRSGTAAMIMEGDFVRGMISGLTHARIGVDADVFPFPSGSGSDRSVVGGGDVAVQLRPSAAAAALMRFLATPESAAIWAAAGGYLSANLDLDLAVYPDDVTRRLARQLLAAADSFRFDLSDLQPAAFGGSDESGLRAELKRFLVDRDVGATSRRLEAAAATAFAGAP